MAKITLELSNFVDGVAGDSEFRSTGVFADRMDLLKSRAAILCGKDKILMQMYLDRGVSFQQIATVAGISRAKIRRRISRLTKALLSGEYIECVRNRHLLSHVQMEIARDHFIGAMSQREIAKKRNCSRYHVKKTLDAIDEIISNGNGSGSCQSTDSFAITKEDFHV